MAGIDGLTAAQIAKIEKAAASGDVSSLSSEELKALPTLLSGNKTEKDKGIKIERTTMATELAQTVSKSKDESWTEFVNNPKNTIVYKSGEKQYVRGIDPATGKPSTYEIIDVVPATVQKWTDRNGAVKEGSNYSSIASFDTTNAPGTENVKKAYSETEADPAKLTTPILVAFNSEKAKKDIAAYGVAQDDASPILHEGDIVQVPVLKAIDNPPPIIPPANEVETAKKEPELGVPTPPEEVKTVPDIDIHKLFEGEKTTQFRLTNTIDQSINNKETNIKDIPEKSFLAQMAVTKFGIYKLDRPYINPSDIEKKFNTDKNGYITLEEIANKGGPLSPQEKSLIEQGQGAKYGYRVKSNGESKTIYSSSNFYEVFGKIQEEE